METLTLIDWIIFLGYVGFVFALGAWFSREQHTNEDFFVGGRTMGWIPIGLSMFASIFSSNSFVGLPTEAAKGDYHEYLGILLIPLVVVPIAACCFVPLFHRLRVTSAYEYLELRFDRRIRLVGSLLFMLYTFAWMGNLLYATSHVIRPVFGLAANDMGTMILILVGVGAFATIYTALGGFKAVIWTDVLQAFALGGGMLAILILALGKVDGGFSGVVAVGERFDKFSMFDASVGADVLKVPNVYFAIAMGFFVFLPWYATTLTAVQRYVSMPTIRDAQRSLVLNGLMTGVVCLLFFVVGSTLFAYYHQGLPASASAGDGFPDLPADQLLPQFVVHEIANAGLLGLMMAGLFAAAMSSIDSGINAMTAAVVCDWLPGRQLSVTFSRGLCCLFGLGAIVAAVVILLQGGNVYQVIIAISGTFLGFLLGAFVLGMISARANAPGVAIGMAAGAIALGCAWSFVGSAWYGMFTSVPTLVVGYLASLAFAAPAQDLTGLVAGHGPLGERPQR